jgi:hypothetical protein
VRSTRLEDSLTAVRHTLSFVFSVAGLFVALSGAWADRPPWAAAHGWRKKYEPHYVGYEGSAFPATTGCLSW